MSQMIQRPKGTADVMPGDVYIWHYMEDLLRHTAESFGYQETRFPTFEHTELFIRGVGDTTDVVQKEMYTFLDKGGRSISLRPEGTASVVRSYIENGGAAMGTPYKVYYIAPNFRYEKPQAGRLRQHHQFGIECFGADSYLADAEAIMLAAEYIKKLKINAILNINSIGCPNCRKDYHTALKEYFKAYEEKLCDTCKTRLEKNPLRILDCKSEICSEIAKSAPKSIDFLCPECTDHFDGLKRTLDSTDTAYIINTALVRGLDYYTKTVFEFVSQDIGAQGTVCGGGRYDGLVKALGGQQTSGVGFGSGLERLILAAKASGFHFPEKPICDLYIIGADDAGTAAAFTLAMGLRTAGLRIQTDTCGRGVKAQMKHANRLGAAYTTVLGETELKSGICSLKNMTTGESCDCPMDNIGAMINTASNI